MFYNDQQMSLNRYRLCGGDPDRTITLQPLPLPPGHHLPYCISKYSRNRTRHNTKSLHSLELNRSSLNVPRNQPHAAKSKGRLLQHVSSEVRVLLSERARREDRSQKAAMFSGRARVRTIDEADLE